MKRIISVLAVVTVMAAMVLATTGPAFAASFASDANKEEGVGPRDGTNYGHCNKDGNPDFGPGNGQETAKGNPSYKGDPPLENGVACGKS